MAIKKGCIVLAKVDNANSWYMTDIKFIYDTYHKLIYFVVP